MLLYTVILGFESAKEEKPNCTKLVAAVGSLSCFGFKERRSRRRKNLTCLKRKPRPSASQSRSKAFSRSETRSQVKRKKLFQGNKTKRMRYMFVWRIEPNSEKPRTLKKKKNGKPTE